MKTRAVLGDFRLVDVDGRSTLEERGRITLGG